MKIKSYDEFMINESKSRGNYTYKEMKNFLENIIKYFAPFKEKFRGPNITVPSDMNSSTMVYELEKDLIPAFDDFYKKYKKQNPEFYIWHFTFLDPSLSKKVKMIEYQKADLKSLYQVAASNQGQLDKVKIGFDSKEKEKFGLAMSRGDYGPLD